MSEDFVWRIGICADGLRQLAKETKVTSIRVGANLHIMGELKEPIQMKLRNTSKVYTIRPTVI